MKRFFKITGIVLLVIVLIFTGILLFFQVTEFRPSGTSPVEIRGSAKQFPAGKTVFTLMTWNIGYAGLGSGMDFFYDGGTGVRDGREQTCRNLAAIRKFVASDDSADFILMQEIDHQAKRSWFQDEMDTISAGLPRFCSMAGINYDCPFIPVPVTDPIGRVKAGVAIFSAYRPVSASVTYFDAFFNWPDRLMMLKRCFITARYKLAEGKELVLINTHNSAYDSTGKLRHRELFILDSVMKSEYGRGNYVIAAGDWNSNPRGFRPGAIQTGDLITTIEPPIGNDFLPGWQFVYDSLHASNRFLDMPYRKGKTRATTIDFFVISPNIKAVSAVTVPQGFRYSDHEAVVVRVEIVR